MDEQIGIEAKDRRRLRRSDLGGYPYGLSGDEIWHGALVIAVADVLEAMASHRPYRPARGTDAAMKEIVSQRGTLFDPGVVDSSVRLLHDHRIDLDAA